MDDGEQLFLCQLMLGPQPELQELARYSSPLLLTSYSLKAWWAPDSSYVVLAYCSALHMLEEVSPSRCNLVSDVCANLAARCRHILSQTSSNGLLLSMLRMTDSSIQGQAKAIHTARLRFLQAIYVLRMEHKVMTLISHTNGNADADNRDVRFSHDSKLIVLCTDDFGHTCQLSVYDCSGRCLAEFSETLQNRQSAALCAQDRIAFVDGRCIRVRDLCSGRLLGSSVECRASGGFGGGGQICTNKPATKLAFRIACLPQVHLFDALSLEQLGTLELAVNGVNIMRTFWAKLVFYGVFGLGLVLGDAGQDETGNSALIYRQMPGSRTHIRTAYCGAVGGSRDASPALSPDGAFMCSFNYVYHAIQVHDARTGLVMLNHAVDVPGQVRGPYSTKHPVFVRWSSCGSRLLVMMKAKEPKLHEPSDHVWVLRF